jgi:hypothetical protein
MAANFEVGDRVEADVLFKRATAVGTIIQALPHVLGWLIELDTPLKSGVSALLRTDDQIRPLNNLDRLA